MRLPRESPIPHHKTGPPPWLREEVRCLAAMLGPRYAGEERSKRPAQPGQGPAGTRKAAARSHESEGRGMLKVGVKGLLRIAAAVWMAAGISIASLGVGSFAQVASGSPWWVIALLAVGAVAVAVLFHSKVFMPLVAKHAQRIRGYGDERVAVYRFFDAKGYLIMAIMMGGGIALRSSGLVPPWFIAFFYTGLGAALAFAGAAFLTHSVAGSARPISPHHGHRGSDD